MEKTRKTASSKMKTTNNFTRTVKPKPVAPEDNWELVGNPTVFRDELPQPFRFLDRCLEN